MMKKFVIIIIFLIAAFQITYSKLWINELMQSNIDFLYAEGDFPDSWFEIYNDSDEAVFLNNYRVGDSEDFEKAFQLKSRIGIAAKNYNIIYCDKVGKGQHTDFRIDSGKGKLYLFNPEGEIVDFVNYPKMLAPNVAYGRIIDGEEEWGFEICPSLLKTNEGGITSKLLPDPDFSVKGHALYNDNKTKIVTVSIPKDDNLPADTRLYVTTDGTEPSTESPMYQNEAKITIRPSETTIIRAKLISANAISPRSVTHSYISHPRDIDLPIISLTTNQEYIYDESKGIWQNYNEDWRRPVNIEFFTEPGSEAHINQLGEFRIHGGWSRNFPQKSLAVYSNKRFGTKNFSYPFWDDKSDIDKSKSFVLRNGGNSFDNARINDSFVQTLFGRNCPNLDWQAYRPVVCYINGQYCGIYALRQRSNEDYVEDCYDGLDDIDMLENWNELKAGTTDSFENLRMLYEGNPTYEQMGNAIDVENFANLYVANTWATNTDFPGNNIVMWRPTAEGGKWRWIMKDLDFLASNPPDFNYFDFLLHTGNFSLGEGNADNAVKLFQVMTSFPEFRNSLIDRFFVYLGDFLRPEITGYLIDEQRDELLPEYDAHLQCYGYPIDLNGWLWRVNYIKEWCAS